MSQTLDANVLLYAADESSPYHQRARSLVAQLAAGPDIVYLFWPAIMAFLRISTHPIVFARPLSAAEAIDNIAQLLARPHVRTSSESESFWDRYRDVSSDVAPTGNLVSDAHFVALMIDHGVRIVWSRDRDFRKFRGIEVRDPFE